MRITLILLAAGLGGRLGKNIPKALVKLNKKYLFLHSLRQFKKLKIFNRIVLVVPSGHEKKFKDILKKEGLTSLVRVINGGVERVDSVFNAISSICESDIVFIHDSARPFVDRKMVDILLKAVKKYGAVVPAIAMRSTLKLCRKGFVVNTLDRRDIYEIQTPQAFKMGNIAAAFKNYKKTKVKKRIWDDSYLIELNAKKVKIVPGDILNIKVTYPKDLRLAELITKLCL